MNFKVLYLILKTDKPVTESASKLRGYIGTTFATYPILHHHAGNGLHLYDYPRIQYKILDGTPFLVGIEEGAEVLHSISGKFVELILGNKTYRIEQKISTEQEVRVGPTRRPIQYQLATPWLALNPSNYKIYQTLADWKDKKHFLNRILVGNILSLCKGLGIIVQKRLYAHSHLDLTKTSYKNIPMLGFQGEFRVNFQIPNYFGLGKGVSHGYGTIRSKVEYPQLNRVDPE